MSFYVLTFRLYLNYNIVKLLAGEESSLAPLPFPNLGASTASALLQNNSVCLVY